ncbi:rhodanese-related sulfurtransferase [Paracoccus luteus]|uniref:oxygen-dependent tRNA uridine(34) hydroxylase TrhO n=1 Tax=Paracoccus luteus TaxID=2508543 RepID=UPI00106F24CC|nr:rhodanese-related sulfurtransferase [Paracoccus luteus]
MLTVAALYHFAALPDAPARRDPLLAACTAAGVRGTLILAAEGVNGTIAGPAEGVAAVLAHIRGWPGFGGLRWKESRAGAMPFGRIKIRLKPEIVTMGQPGVDPTARVGARVAPADWNALIAAPDVAVIDTRNAYEVAIGTFRGAVDPGTRSFRDFPAWWRANAGRFAGKRIAMFCTGGIRCEKSTNFLLAQGVPEVFHLDGGVLKYLEDVPVDDSLWNGACFVFDRRVSLTHGLEPGGHVLCHACRRPLAPADTARPEYEEGVACHLCADEYGEADRARFRERQRQVDRGELFAG